MLEKISASVSVGLLFDHKMRKCVPKWVKWEGKLYKIEKIGFHHTYREGRVFYHVFSVASETLFFRLVLNTETLIWRLEELSDGLPD